MFAGGTLVSGVGMSLNADACLTGVYLCIVFYAASKVLIYILLAEKVHVVWSAGVPIRRFQSRIWIFCAVVMLGYVVIFVLMLIGRVGYLNPPDENGNQSCTIGLEPMASIPLLAYDAWLNCMLTSLFVYPLLSPSFWGRNRGSGGDVPEGRRPMNPKLRALAKRTCFAAAIALGTSVVNILVLTLLHGRQLGWVCLASCGLDVTINAIAIFLITRKTHSDDSSSSPRHDKSPPAQAHYPHNLATLHAKSHFDVDEDVTTTQEHSHPPHPPHHPTGAGVVPFTRAAAAAVAAVALSPKSIIPGSGKHRKSLSSPKHQQHPHGQVRVHTPSTKRPSTGGHGGPDGMLESRDATLSQIGDFAVTRDDGETTGGTTSVGSVVAGFMGGSSRASRTSLRKDKGIKGNNMQMVPVLVQADGRGVTSTLSLGGLQEEFEPRGSESVPKMYAFGDDDDDYEDELRSKKAKETSLRYENPAFSPHPRFICACLSLSSPLPEAHCISSSPNTTPRR